MHGGEGQSTSKSFKDQGSRFLYCHDSHVTPEKNEMKYSVFTQTKCLQISIQYLQIFLSGGKQCAPYLQKNNGQFHHDSFSNLFIYTSLPG